MRTVLIALLASVTPSLAAAQAVQILHELDAPVGPSLTAAGGWLYGVTPTGGTGRGEIYRVAPDTGLVTVTAAVPGPAPSSPIVNSRLVSALGGPYLYGVSRSSTESIIFQVHVPSGWASTSLTAPAGLRGLTGLGNTVYGFLERPNGIDLARWDGNAMTPVLPIFTGDITAGGPGELVAGSDGWLYFAMVADRTPILRMPHLIRVSPVTRAMEELPMPHAATGSDYADLRATGDGRVLVHVATPSRFHDWPWPPSTSRVDVFDIATGTSRTLCQFGYTSAGITPPAIDDSLLVVISNHPSPNVRECNPTTGAVPLWPLLTEIGSAPRLTRGPDNFLYGVASRAPQAGSFVYRLAVTGTLPAIDTDGDGLDNTWETTYGLDPSTASGADGADGDPDYDGHSNLEELAAGTHPRGTQRRYLAEGATGAFFSTRISLFNPSSRPARVLLRFLTDTGEVFTRGTWLSSQQPYSIELGDVPGLASANVSTAIEADARIVVDRVMRWGRDGYGSHAEAAVPSPSTQWFLAEGSTSGDFALFYLLQNPEPVAVTATIRYLRPFGQPVIERSYLLPPASRTTIAVDAQGPDLESTDVSAAVTATAPIIVERAMYLSRPGQPFAAGHASAGVTAPALEWFLAEGATGPFFDMFILIANPSPTPAVIAVDYLLLGGGVLSKTYTVAANSRHTIWVDDEELPSGSGQKPLAFGSLSARIRSTNQVPVVVERTMWWPKPGSAPDFWYEAHNSPGATAAATFWAFAGAEVGPGGLETYVLLANPSSRMAEVTLRVCFQDGTTETWHRALPTNSRTNVALGEAFPSAFGRGPFGVYVESEPIPHLAAQPIVVEYSIYRSPGGVTWASGANALATVP